MYMEPELFSRVFRVSTRDLRVAEVSTMTVRVDGQVFCAPGSLSSSWPSSLVVIISRDVISGILLKVRKVVGP